MAGGQALRPTQFILTYGVGSILEAPGGPRVIPVFGSSFWNPHLDAIDKDYFIVESNASAVLKGGRIFRIPTNTDLQMVDSDIPYGTIKFPEWALCLKHKKLYRLDSSDYTTCPTCLKGLLGASKRSIRSEAIRFVRACPRGHMDDVDWNFQVHSDHKSCPNRVFDWHGGHNSLDGVEIICNVCKDSATLKDVYNGSTSCNARIVEERNFDPAGCHGEMQVMLRGQSSLRMPVIITAITIPPRDTNTYLKLVSMDIQKLLFQKSWNQWTKVELLNMLAGINSRNKVMVTDEQIRSIKETTEQEIQDAIRQIMEDEEGHREVSEEDIRLQEFVALRRAANFGSPPPARKDTNGQFEVDIHQVRKIVAANGTLRITPINRLRAVIVQRGYRRITTNPEASHLVETFLNKSGVRWYPGVETRGEGVFFDFPADAALKMADASKLWMDRYDANADSRYHPMFVWWHTFSHALLNVLSIDSGYSSTAIRERIYFDIDDAGVAKGGILLYTTQSGGDGSLGGLIAVAGNFRRALDVLRTRLKHCSNDPLCSSHKIKPDRSNGAACYACMLVSETSCEHMNRFLDRNLLKGLI